MMNQVIDYLRYAEDSVLPVADLLQMRPYLVRQDITTWSGTSIGDGTASVVMTPVYNGSPTVGTGATCNPRVRQVTANEVVLSGGALRDKDLKVGPVVYPYSTSDGYGGTDPLTFAPTATGTNECYFNITGPDFPAPGSNFKLVRVESTKRVAYYFYLRNTASI